MRHGIRCTKEGLDVNDYIYIYYIKDNKLIYDRTVSRFGGGPDRAKEAVAAHEGRGNESFYTIGTITRDSAPS